METVLIRKARGFAEERHEGQFRKGEAREPYMVHVEEVAALVAEFGGDETAVCAAYLHDTIEDCPSTSREELAREFSDEIASVVAELTDDKSLPKAQRKDLQVANAAKKSVRAALIKTCDKTSNLRAIADSPPADWSTERKREYLEWSRKVFDGLGHRNARADACFEDAYQRLKTALDGP